MRAQIPYLAGLARQAAGRPALRPPHQLFSRASYPPGRGGTVRRPPGDAAVRSFPPARLPSGSGEEPPAPPRIASPRDEDTGRDRAGGAAGAPAAPAGPAPDAAGPGVPAAAAGPAPDAAGPAAPGHQEAPRRRNAPGSAQVAAPASVAPRTEFSPAGAAPPARGAAPAAPPDAGLVPHPAWPPLAPESRTGTQGGTPAQPPRTIEPVPVPGETDRRPPPSGASPAASASVPGPEGAAGSHRGPLASETGVSAALASGPGPGTVGSAGPHRDLAGGEAGIPVTLGPRDAAGDPGRSRGRRRPAISRRRSPRLSRRSRCSARSRAGHAVSLASRGPPGYRSARSRSPSSRQPGPPLLPPRSSLRHRWRAAGLALLRCSLRARAPTGCGTGSAAGTASHRADGGDTR